MILFIRHVIFSVLNPWIDSLDQEYHILSSSDESLFRIASKRLIRSFLFNTLMFATSFPISMNYLLQSLNLLKKTIFTLSSSFVQAFKLFVFQKTDYSYIDNWCWVESTRPNPGCCRLVAVCSKGLAINGISRELKTNMASKRHPGGFFSEKSHPGLDG